ncbi:MAG: cobamide remodeling phosphodiesterase CbiR [Smithellaceae bacterium]|nr:cobamide remodeling phosphodiesterase CbiR [Smithellaceae bacterium]
MKTFPFRLGTTSYILPAGILPNVRFLAPNVQDVELVLFEVDDGPNNLPTQTEIAELAEIAREHDLTYTVHLPLDLRLADDGLPRHASLDKARRVIDRTRPLDPWAYVLHLDGKSVRGAAQSQTPARWLDQAVRALELVGQWAGGPQLLAMENLEGYPSDFYEPVLARSAASRTVDVGHLWLDGRDPVVYLQKALPRTRVVHLHGIDARDHQSLAHVPPAELCAVLCELVRSDYRGVVTVEVFGQSDFLTSLDAIARAADMQNEIFSPSPRKERPL